ncbi:MAG TPA: ester cyclase [Chitinophagaceae bacterium]|nr:ester cyclase [Chitinophagaceae bacterium]
MYKLTLTTILFNLVFAACGNDKQPSSNTVAKEMKGDINIDQLTEERLRRMDSLDFQFYSNQVWDSLAISHDADIKVYYPDGAITTGLFPQHIDMLKPMFVFSPDTKAISHPVKFGTGDWTCVIGEVEGIFSKAMPVGNGKTIPPTGKKFKFSMCTVGHWKNGKMIEEYLFWDNHAILKQIGLSN